MREKQSGNIRASAARPAHQEEKLSSSIIYIGSDQLRRRPPPQNRFLENLCAVPRNDVLGVGPLFSGTVMLLGDKRFFSGAIMSLSYAPSPRRHPEQGEETEPDREGSPSLRWSGDVQSLFTDDVQRSLTIYVSQQGDSSRTAARLLRMTCLYVRCVIGFR